MAFFEEKKKEEREGGKMGLIKIHLSFFSERRKGKK